MHSIKRRDAKRDAPPGGHTTNSGRYQARDLGAEMANKVELRVSLSVPRWCNEKVAAQPM